MCLCAEISNILCTENKANGALFGIWIREGSLKLFILAKSTRYQGIHVESYCFSLFVNSKMRIVFQYKATRDGQRSVLGCVILPLAAILRTQDKLFLPSLYCGGTPNLMTTKGCAYVLNHRFHSVSISSQTRVGLTLISVPLPCLAGSAKFPSLKGEAGKRWNIKIKLPRWDAFKPCESCVGGAPLRRGATKYVRDKRTPSFISLPVPLYPPQVYELMEHFVFIRFMWKKCHQCILQNYSSQPKGLSFGQKFR